MIKPNSDNTLTEISCSFLDSSALEIGTSNDCLDLTLILICLILHSEAAYIAHFQLTEVSSTTVQSVSQLLKFNSFVGFQLAY